MAHRLDHEARWPRPPGSGSHELHALLPDLDPAPGDAAHVEQVVDEPDHLIDLPLEHRRRRRTPRALSSRSGEGSRPRCGSAPGDSGARGRGSPGTRSCGDRPPAGLLAAPQGGLVARDRRQAPPEHPEQDAGQGQDENRGLQACVVEAAELSLQEQPAEERSAERGRPGRCGGRRRRWLRGPASHRIGGCSGTDAISPTETATMKVAVCRAMIVRNGRE